MFLMLRLLARFNRSKLAAKAYLEQPNTNGLTLAVSVFHRGDRKILGELDRFSVNLHVTQSPEHAGLLLQEAILV